MLNWEKHIDYCKGLEWVRESGEGRNDTLVHRAIRKGRYNKLVSFATVTTRPEGMANTFIVAVTYVGSESRKEMTIVRSFEGRNCHYSARKWAEILMFFPPDNLSVAIGL